MEAEATCLRGIQILDPDEVMFFTFFSSYADTELKPNGLFGSWAWHFS